jgi:hypothetical protein
MRVVLACLLLAGALCGSAASASAQTISLASPDAGKWDAWLGVSSFSGRRSDLNAWTDWYQTPALEAEVARYWSPHLRTAIRAARTGEGRAYSQQPIFVPGQPVPGYRFAEHWLSTTDLSASLSYQFLENAWVHPFVAAGVRVSREHERLEIRTYTDRPGPTEHVENDWWRGRPFLGFGAKFYLSPRAFIRSELQVSFGSGEVAHVGLGGGVGIDF